MLKRIFAAFVLLFAFAVTGNAQSKFLRFLDIYGDRADSTYRGDLWTTVLMVEWPI